MGELKGTKIRLACTLYDQKGTFIASPGKVVTIGDDVDERTGRQLLVGGSATLVEQKD